MQEFVAPNGRDLRLIVAGGELVGCSERIAAPGEWRTNVSLGGSARPADPTPLATTLALAAASAVGADLVGVDLIPLAGDRYVVLELNGAVEFDEAYSLTGRNIYRDAADALQLTLELSVAGHRRPAAPAGRSQS